MHDTSVNINDVIGVEIYCYLLVYKIFEYIFFKNKLKHSYDNHFIFSVVLFLFICFLFTDFNISDGMLIALESFDFEKLSLYNITIFAFDGSTMVSSHVIVNILPVNEFDPIIIMSKTVYNYTEGGRLTICLKVSVLHYNN